MSYGGGEGRLFDTAARRRWPVMYNGNACELRENCLREEPIRSRVAHGACATLFLAYRSKLTNFPP